MEKAGPEGASLTAWEKNLRDSQAGISVGTAMFGFK